MAITIQSLGKLPNGVHFTYVEQTIKRVEGVTIDNELARQQLARLKAAFAEEDRCFKLSQKSLLSDKIREADTNRDRVYTLIKRTVETYLELPVADYAEAATVLSQKLKDYRIDVRERLQSETGKLDNLLQDFGVLQELVTKLGLTALVADLRKYNDEVKQQMLDRADERAPRELGELRNARRVTDAEYAELVELLNALLKLAPTAALTTLAQQMNEDIDYLRRQVLKASGASAAAGGEKADGDDGQNGSDGADGASDSGSGGGSGSDDNTGGGSDNTGGGSGSGSGDTGEDSIG